MTIRDRRNGCEYFDNTEVERIDHGDNDYGDLEIYYACGCRYVYDYDNTPGCRYHEEDYYCNDCKLKKGGEYNE